MEEAKGLPPQPQPRKVVVVRDFLNNEMDGSIEGISAPQTAAVPNKRNKSKFESRAPSIGRMRNSRPGTGYEREKNRMRSRTPNENSVTAVNIHNKLDQKSVNEGQDAMFATTVAASSRQNRGGNYGTLSVTSSTHRRVKSRIQNNVNSNASFQLDVEPALKPPGPATYEKKSMFPSGPKHHIQQKTKRDSLFETTIARNISPGPAIYASLESVSSAGKGPSARIGASKRFSVKEPGSLHFKGWSRAGPGSYTTEGTRHLKQGARVTIGNSKRSLGQDERSLSPSNSFYTGQLKANEKRSLSNERNSKTATIGNAGLRKREIEITPGPSQYDTLSARGQVGDQQSIHVPFATALRPISAKVGELRTTRGPGPQDYSTVDLKFFKRNKAVVPSMTFATSTRDATSRDRLRSPGPQHYSPNKDVKLQKSPSCCFGNAIREVAERREETTAKKARIHSSSSPGPADYTRDRSISNGGQSFTRTKYVKKEQTIQPGPSDYNFDANMRLKSQPRAIIPRAKKESSLVPRDKSPGPNDYRFNLNQRLRNQPRATIGRAKVDRSLSGGRSKSPGVGTYEPKKLHFKRRSVVPVFSTQKREGIFKDNKSPGPGAYMLPVKFYERPSYAVQDGMFRFV